MPTLSEIAPSFLGVFISTNLSIKKAPSTGREAFKLTV
jgi:hypothetical protein